MAQPLLHDLVARRNAPFAREWSDFIDETTGAALDFSAATVAMEVRQRGAQAGDALISLSEVALDRVEGLIADEDSIRVYIDEATLAALPVGKAGASMVFVYDLVVQRSGEVPIVVAQGFFTVEPGVTDRLFFITAGGDRLVASGIFLIAR